MKGIGTIFLAVMLMGCPHPALVEYVEPGPTLETLPEATEIYTGCKFYANVNSDRWFSVTLAADKTYYLDISQLIDNDPDRRRVIGSGFIKGIDGEYRFMLPAGSGRVRLVVCIYSGGSSCFWCGDPSGTGCEREI